MSQGFVNSIGNVYLPGQSVQVVSVVNTSMGVNAAIIPFDNTIPQITEGAQFMTASITPTSANNTLKIEVVCALSNSLATTIVTAALFQDSTSDALASAFYGNPTADNGQTMTFTYIMTAGTTSLTAFKFRAGANTASTTTFNGTAGAARLGGSVKSYIIITEIQV